MYPLKLLVSKLWQRKTQNVDLVGVAAFVIFAGLLRAGDARCPVDFLACSLSLFAPCSWWCSCWTAPASAP